VSTEAPSVNPEASAEAPSISLELESRPETLTLVRGMLGGIADRLAIDPELLDDLKTAVSEACNNVVLHAYPAAIGPLAVLLYVRPEGIEVIVRDQGCGIAGGPPREDQPQGVGLPVIRALTQRSEFRARPDGGTEVWMMFPAQRDGKPLFDRPPEAVPADSSSEYFVGDAVVSVSPVALLPGVLGRLARALAASARFSLDRFSDVYLVTDAIAAHAVTAASGERISFAIKAGTRRLELTVGPFRPGSADELRGHSPPAGPPPPIDLLSDELAAEPLGAAELLRVVMVDDRGSSSGSAARPP
jgi:serine/threonine-protein kinase RsbW